MFRSALLTVTRLFLVTSVALGLTSNSAAAESAVVTVAPFTMTFLNPCTAETLVFTAELHTKTHGVLTDQHEQVAMEANIANAKGSTLTGVNYVFTAAFMTVDNFGPGTTSIIQSTQNANRLKEDPSVVVSPYTGDDWQLKITFKLTINANGTTTVTHPPESETKCR
jgi:hypothetical protein